MTDNEFIDPLNDPRFPDRPDTPDFWRLAEIGLAHDGEALEGKGPGVVIAGMVDEPTLMYMIKHRLGTAFGPRMAQFDKRTQFMIMAIYIDAFAMGVDFQKRGGHRD